MTFEEALQELEIGPESDPDEIRRAYLRKLKTRKPEVDPEGFRRLRGAYDLLNGSGVRFTVPHTPAPPPPVVVSPDPPLSTVSISPLADIQRRLGEITHPDERLALLRRAVRENPREERPRWWLVRELEREWLKPELIDLLRRFDQEGFPGFFEHLASHHPDELDAQDIARLEALGDPESLACAAEGWYFRGAPDLALQDLLRAMDRSDAAGNSHSPPPDRILVLIARLQAQGSLSEAETLLARFRERLRGAARELDLLDDQAAALWQLVQEIALLSPRFPPSLREAIAQAVAESSFEQAIPMLRWLIQGDPMAARQAAPEIEQLPVLAELYGHLFEDLPLPEPSRESERPPEQPKPWEVTKPFFLGCLLPASIVSALLLLLGYTAPPLSTPAARSAQRPWSIPSPPPPRPTLRFDSIDEAMQMVCGGGGPVLPEAIEICDRAREMVTHLRQRDCDQARRAQWRLRDAVLRANSPLMNALSDAIRTEGAPVCGAL